MKLVVALLVHLALLGVILEPARASSSECEGTSKKAAKDDEEDESSFRVRLGAFDSLLCPLPVSPPSKDRQSYPSGSFPTVCVKVMDDIKATLAKDELRNKPKIEQAMGAYCAKETLNAREKKVCYYIDPIKRDVAQPFSLGMSSLKVCQRITQSNPEICTVRMPVQTEKMAKQDISKLRVKQLKQILADRGVECKGCVEKEEFVARVKETEHLASDEF